MKMEKIINKIRRIILLPAWLIMLTGFFVMNFIQMCSLIIKKTKIVQKVIYSNFIQVRKEKLTGRPKITKNKSMKLLLLRTYTCLEKFYFPGYIHQPFGILALAAFMKPFCTVKAVDSVAEGWDCFWEKKGDPEIINRGLKIKRLLKIIKKFKPDVVGITWFYSLEDDCIKETINNIKKFFPRIKIIVGGPEPSVRSRDILEENPEIDIVVFGEGELTLKELVLKNFQNLNEVLGIAYRQGNKIILNSARPRILDFDGLPSLAREFVPSANYSKQYFFSFIFNYLRRLKLPFKINCSLSSSLARIPVYKFFYLAYNIKHGGRKFLPEADIQTARGCPNQCTFCSLRNIWGYRWMARSAENSLKEIDFLIKKHKARHINFWDENFNIDRKRTIDICRGIVEKNYKITLSIRAGVYVPTLDEEVLRWLNRAGAKEMRFSIESGNQEVLDKVIKKRIDLKTVKPIINFCKKLGIRTEGAFIFGIPGQTIETMEDNLKFAKDCGFDRIIKFIYQPFRNTELYEICKEKGYFTKDFNPQKLYQTGSKCYVETEDFSPDDVLRLARKKTAV